MRRYQGCLINKQQDKLTTESQSAQCQCRRNYYGFDAADGQRVMSEVSVDVGEFTTCTRKSCTCKQANSYATQSTLADVIPTSIGRLLAEGGSSEVAGGAPDGRLSRRKRHIPGCRA